MNGTVVLTGEGKGRTSTLYWVRGIVVAVSAALITLAAVRLLSHPPAPSSGGTGRHSGTAGASGDEITEGRRNAIVRASEQVGPAVVSITAVETRVVRYSQEPPWADEFFNRFFGDFPTQAYRERVPKFGSGFIFDSDGHVLTNEHVVSGADEIEVTLPDGRQFKGKVLGGDADYDVAVIKIPGSNLPSVRMGNSDDLLVGEWAIAIGNPFGYLLGDARPTVTVGVVSATNRDIKADVNEGGIYKNMIQTDAAINPGNSGGPLVNTNGEVIGINSFIFTQGGGSLGIGFAIPIKTASEVAGEIIKYGGVQKPWIGMSVVQLSPQLAAYFGVQDLRGLVVATIERGSPVHRAGIQVGDIIRAVQGQEVSDARAAYRLIFGARSGDTIRFTVEREGRRRDIAVTLEPMPGSRGQ